MLRANHFTGGAITGAVSAIDIALWDIKGKAFGVPVYELLGGRMRHKARLYGHVKGRTIEKLVEEAVRLKQAGFTALGHLNPLLDESEDEPFYKSHAARIEEAIDNVRRLREAVGPKVDLCIEIHRRLTPPEAIALGRGIEKYTPMFFEDPLRPNSFDAMADVARHIDIPIATGERFHSLYQFQTLLTRNAVQYLRPDVCLVGGITGAKKVAAIAEAHDAWVVPHNPLSPISTAACLQIAACIPNFAIQEYPSRTPDLDGGKELLGNDLATGLEEQVDGFIAIPERAGDRRGTGGGRGAAVPVPAAADQDAAACGWVGGGYVVCCSGDRTTLARLFQGRNPDDQPARHPLRAPRHAGPGSPRSGSPPTSSGCNWSRAKPTPPTSAATRPRCAAIRATIHLCISKATRRIRRSAWN